MLVDKPSEQVRLHNRIITPQSESMYLMADLRHMDGYVHMCSLFVCCMCANIDVYSHILQYASAVMEF